VVAAAPPVVPDAAVLPVVVEPVVEPVPAEAVPEEVVPLAPWLCETMKAAPSVVSPLLDTKSVIVALNLAL
jgi:hypothetical protein